MAAVITNVVKGLLAKRGYLISHVGEGVPRRLDSYLAALADRGLNFDKVWIFDSDPEAPVMGPVMVVLEAPPTVSAATLIMPPLIAVAVVPLRVATPPMLKAAVFALRVKVWLAALLTEPRLNV